MRPTYQYRATVARVIDGDTAEVVVDLGFRVSVRAVLRLHGIDAPEVRGPTRPEGLRSAAHLRGMIEGREVTIDSKNLDKYGRTVAVVWLAGVGDSVNALMVRDGWAVEMAE
jgi:micrococcal nuclease